MKKPLILVTVLVAIGLGFSLSLVWYKPEPIQLQAITWLGEQAKPLPDFALTDHNGKPFNRGRLQGAWHLLFFGYTHCPDICPESLTMLANMMDYLTDEKVKKQLQVTFISVDPKRDDQAKLKAYVSYFHPDFIGVRGDLDQVNILTDAVGILHYIESNNSDTYEVAHSGNLILIDPQARFAGVFSAPHDSQKIAHDLTQLING